MVNYMGYTHIFQYRNYPYYIFFRGDDMRFQRIRDLREDRDKKQIELADYLNVDQSTYSDYERGEINIPIEQLIRIADFYQVSLDYLVGRTDVPEPYSKARRR